MNRSKYVAEFAQQTAKHKYIYAYLYTQINGTVLKVPNSEINRYVAKYQKIKCVFKSTSAQSGRRFLEEFTKVVLGHMLQMGSLTGIQILNNANSLDYLLSLK